MTAAIVVGTLANKPWNGGNAWVPLTYVLGLQRLGIDAWFIEDLRGEPAPDSAAFFRLATRQLGVDTVATLLDGRGDSVVGMSPQDVGDLATECDFLINVSGTARLPAVLAGARRKIYVDLDPGYTQFWHAAGVAPLAGHDCYFTIGVNIGRGRCPIPTVGLEWHPTRPPVLLDAWPVAGGDRDVFSTVASWRGAYGPVEFGGRRYGVKAHEFRKFVDLPRRVPLRFELALDIDEADARDVRMLEEGGWALVNPRSVAATPFAFRDYVRRAGAEFSVAQAIYVDTSSGWLSDRTARYLASGKPALVQATGVTDSVSTTAGMRTFRTLTDAVRAAEAIRSEYAHHSTVARATAETLLDSRTVLTELLETAGLHSRARRARLGAGPSPSTRTPPA